MKLNEVIGQDHIKSHLIDSAKMGRVPHAQLFVGNEGHGILAMALAYARYLLCDATTHENSCHLKLDKFVHPDLHFAFPVATTAAVKKHPVSNLFLTDWRSFLLESSYQSIYDWYNHIGIENKQGQIGVDEANDILKKLSLKAFEGGYKVLLLWGADKLNTEASNKLLKLIEEPPEQTVIILMAQHENQVIDTIKSRCQILHFPPVAEQALIDFILKDSDRTLEQATLIAQQSNGNVKTALDLMTDGNDASEFERWFIIWVRSAFMAKKNKAVIQDLISWSDTIAKTGREHQKQFLSFCIQVFRQALLLNYNAKSLVFHVFQDNDFKLSKFAPFVHNGNIVDIYNQLDSAIYHIERNGNAKIVLTDLSIKLTRLLHKKPE